MSGQFVVMSLYVYVKFFCYYNNNELDTYGRSLLMRNSFSKLDSKKKFHANHRIVLELYNILLFISLLRRLTKCFVYFFFYRLNREISGGAWCPSKQLSASYSGQEWIQVDLEELYTITAIATQGRFGNGMGVEFAEEYWIEYSRDNGTTWNKWTDMNGDYVSFKLYDMTFDLISILLSTDSFMGTLHVIIMIK